MGKLRIKLQFWDTCGLEQYQAINNIYYRGADIALILYDISVRSSINSCNSWLRIIKENCKEKIKIYLIGTKADLNTEGELINSMEEFKKNIQSTYEISAKTGEGIENALNEILKRQIMDDNEIAKFNEEPRARLSSVVVYEKKQCSC